MLSLNQIISQITTLASAHYQIAESGVGDFAEWQAKERNYPLLWVFHEQSSINERYLVHDIRLICADRVITGEEGDDTEGHEQEVLSDTQLVLLDFLAYFNNQYGQDYDIIRTATIEPFTERFNDRVAGNSVVIQIRQRWEWNKCSIPESGAVIPPTVDGLTLYDFSDPTVFARLTAQQLTDLETLLCSCDDATVQLNGVTVGTIASGGTESFTVNLDGVPSGTWDGDSWEVTSPPCADATVQLNGVDMADIPSGDTENILVLQSNDMTQVGSKQGTHWRIDDSAISINGSSVASVKAEDPLDIDVTQDGSPVGSWNGSAWIIPSCPSSSSLSVAVSNATPDYNGTVTITATPSGISPTYYTFLIACQNDGDAYVTQASNVLVWTVNRVGAIKVSVTATDGVETVGATADLTVTDPMNYAAKLVDYDMRNNITLVDGLVDIVGDSSGNGHDVTAISSVNRAFYDAYSKRYDTGASIRNLRNTASNPLSGVADFTMFIKFQKQGADSNNQRVITFGTSGRGFAVAPYNVVGGTVLIGTNDFAQYQTATVDVVGGEPFAIVKNGANPYDVYADGVITSVVSSSGTTPATIPTGNGIYLGTQSGFFPLIGSIQRIVVFDSVLTATQVAAVNERIKVLHP